MLKSKESDSQIILAVKHSVAYFLSCWYLKEEQKSERPYAVLFHDIISDLEMNYLIEESKPKLSRKRYDSNDIQEALAKHEFKDGNKARIVHKTG